MKYASDKSVKERLQIWFIKDHRKGKRLILIKKYLAYIKIKIIHVSIAIRFRIFNLILKVASCFLYVLEVLMNPTTTNYSSSSKYNKYVYVYGKLNHLKD